MINIQLKILSKYIQDKQMHFKEFHRIYLDNSNNKKLTDYERGYISGVCHAFKKVNRDLAKDNEDINCTYFKIGSGLKWCRKR